MARSLNGTSDYMQVSSTPITGWPATMAVWAYPTSTATGNVAWWLGDASSTLWNAFYMQLGSSGGSPSVLSVVSASNNTFLGANTTANWSLNAWNHCAGVFDGTNFFSYLNGGNSSSHAAGSAPLSFNVNVFGAADVNGVKDNYFTGRLAEAGLWNVALTANEIAALAAGVNPRRIRPGSLKSYWPLWGLSSPEPDLSGGAYNLTLQGTSLANHAPLTLSTTKSRSEQDGGTIAAPSFVFKPIVYRPRFEPAFFE